MKTPQLIAIVVGLAILIAAVIFINDNGNLPVGPAINNNSINSIDVLQGGTAVALNVESLNFTGDSTVTVFGDGAGINVAGGGGGAAIEGQNDLTPVVPTIVAINAGNGLIGSDGGSGVLTLAVITPTPQPTATPSAGGGFSKSQGLPVSPATTPTACHGFTGIPNGQSFSIANTFPDANDTYYSPFYVEAEININCIHLERHATGNMDCRVGIYEMNNNGQPGSLEVDFGTITYNGVAGWYSNTVNHDLPAGSYLTAWLCNASQDIGATFVESDVTLSCETTTSFNSCAYAWNVNSPSNTPSTAFPASGDAWDDWLLANNNSVLHRIVYGWTVN